MTTVSATSSHSCCIGSADAEARHERIALVDHHVDRHADQQFRQHVEEFVQYRIQRAEPDIAPVRAGELQQAFQRMSERS